jgi:Bacterial Ig-like domain
MPYAQNVAQVYPLGPCQITAAGNDLGHTDESGVKVTVKAAAVEAMVAKYGKAAVSFWANGLELELDFTLMQTDMDILKSAFPLMTLVTGAGGIQKLTAGQYSGTNIPSVAVVLTPFVAGLIGTSLSCLAVPIGDFSPVYEGAKWAGYKCKFKAIINESGAANGALSFAFGNLSASGSATPPSVSSVVPANGASGVSAATTVVATMSENIDGTTVTVSRVELIEDPAGTPALIPGSIALVNAGAATTITFTPTSSLPTGKTYSFVMSGAIKDQNGNGLMTVGVAGFASNFAT